MPPQVPLDESLRADDPAADDARADHTHQVAPDLAYQRVALVNVVFFGSPDAGDRGWVLVDAGLPGTKLVIAGAAAARFGELARPCAIVLTHGHFDHVGALEQLAAEWRVPIYAHPIEHPFLDGRQSYPPPDPSVGGGLMCRLAPFFPRGPIDVGSWVRELPGDGSVPGMKGWRWIHTPGHAPGHVSLWRAADRAMIVGDAFITTRQESAYAVTAQEPEMHGPPMYYTTNWDNARASVELLASLEPERAVTGHGRAMQGREMRRALHELARTFDRVAVPDEGRYVDKPAEREEGGEYREP
jgi:glyoxylase-like metal-dependent hydrolase (beta-lactamase superfamily II)